MADNLPVQKAPLDRTAIERVLARAAELQVATTSTEQSGMLTEAQLVEIAKEAGISPTMVSQALAEERSRISVPSEEGFVASVTGLAMARPGSVSAVVSASVARSDFIGRVLARRGVAERPDGEPGWLVGRHPSWASDEGGPAGAVPAG